MQILKLMASSDGLVADREREQITTIANEYFQTYKIPEWAKNIVDPFSMDILANEIPFHLRELTAKLAYRVISCSREDYQFSVNSDEMQTFNQLCDALGLTKQLETKIIAEAKNEISLNFINQK